MAVRKLFSFFLLFLFVSAFVSGVVSAQNVERDLEEGVENVKSNAENIAQFTEKERWEYLGEAWKENLLKNSVISAIDSTLRKFNVFFAIVVAEDYDLSFGFFFAVIYFIFFMALWDSVSKIVMGEMEFPTKYSPIFAILLSIICAHAGIYVFLSSITFNLLFFRGGAWSWVWTGLFFFFYVVFLIYMNKVFSMFVHNFKKMRDKRNQKNLENRVERQEAFSEELRQGSSDFNV